MIDLHSHTTYSDGALIPAESARRARHAGYRALAFTDHADAGNLSHILARIPPLARDYALHADIDLVAGVELTHVPPPLIEREVARARELGAQLVLMHGETVVEPVAAGTNLAALLAGVDILAHPGLITDEEAALAAERGVFLEVTSRGGHSLTNGHVVNMARRHGARLVLNNDAHGPGDWISAERRRAVALGAGMTPDEIARAEADQEALVRRILTGGP